MVYPYIVLSTQAEASSAASRGSELPLPVSIAETRTAALTSWSTAAS